MDLTGFVFYDGPSELDGSPIVGIAVLESENSKTGNMVQTYILRADMHPLEAIATGADSAICGDCIHRGPGPNYVRVTAKTPSTRTCYVDVGRSVASIYGCWTRGGYPMIDPADGGLILSGRYVRSGSYGDPAAIHYRHWLALIARSAGHTGYTHQWRLAQFQAFRTIVMASADSVSDMDLARAMGWRTFRVRTESQALAVREIECPASEEAGHRKQCIDCRACDGADRPGKVSVAIVVHGRGKKHFQTDQVPA